MTSSHAIPEEKALRETLLENSIEYTFNVNLLSLPKWNTSSLKSEINELISFIKNKPQIMREYAALIQKIKALEALPNSKRVDRQLLLKEIEIMIDSIYLDILKKTLLRLEFLAISKAVALHMNADLKWLERYAVDYFSEYFQKSNKKITKISFLPKLDGDQLGRRMCIEYLERDNQNKIIYFIKTHQNGSRRNGSTIIPVDPKEIFIYKLLELTHFGPKVHFFLNPLSIGGYFIATQDEGFTKASYKLKLFNTYEHLRESAEEKFDITHYKASPDNPMQIAILNAHLFQRIFHLWDIITNPGNYGRVAITANQNTRHKWRIIDFRVFTLDEYYDPSIAESFTAGKDMDGYVGNLQLITKNLSADERLLTAKKILEDLEFGRLSHQTQARRTPLLDAIKEAFCYVVRLLHTQESLDCLGFSLNDAIGKLATIDLKKLENTEIMGCLDRLTPKESGDLGRYIKAVSNNYVKFSEAIKPAVVKIAIR